MITHPVALAVVLALIEAVVLWLASYKATSRYFNFIPSLFWIYFLPMLASTFGWIDPASPMYSTVSNYLLPASLFLLLMTVDLCAILALGPLALGMFFIGSAGIGIGVLIAWEVVKSHLDPGFWAGFGALAGSWTGGSANMIAVKEALGASDAVFLPMVIVDTIVPYAWMGLLVIAASHQQSWDKYLCADQRLLKQVAGRVATANDSPVRLQWMGGVVIIILGLLVSVAAKTLGKLMPQIPQVINVYAWTIMIVSLLGVLASLTPLKRLEQHGSTKIGQILLYFVLTTIGAKASLLHMKEAGLLLFAGVIIVLVHMVILLIGARLLRAPFILAAIASQANVGGVASAPMVAEIYHKGFASVGLLLAILGNMVGTYLGIAIGHLCRIF